MSERTSNPAGATSGQGGQKQEKSKFRMESQQERTARAKLQMEKRWDKLETARNRLANQKPPKKRGPLRRMGGAAEHGVHGFVHGKLYEVEHENVGTEGAHRSELAGEVVGGKMVRFARKRVRTRPARAAARAESQFIKAQADYQTRKLAQEQPETFKSAAARLWHREKLKRQYRKQAREAAKQGARAAEKTAVTSEKLAEKAVGAVRRHPVGALLLAACVLLLVVMQSCMSSLVSVGNGTVGAVAASTYPAQDGDMLGAEAAYCALEAELQNYLDTYTSTHSYDEYHFDLDEIEHEPYVLTSILSALHEGEWTLAQVQGTLQTLFDRQYILTENVVRQVRYRTETRTAPDGGSYTVRVPYNYYICTVTLENFNLSHLPIHIMGEGQLSRYALFMATLGNRPDLFPGSGYIGKYVTNGPTLHDVPEAYLSDPTFAALLTEAEKYIGYPYVWGGHSPSTSFDCSGYLSYVLNQCGWDIGRLGAQGLYNYCTRTNSPRPGDLVFFKNTYAAPDPNGVTHCGLYVGDGWMLHCGDPIGYANLNSSYWQSHFYAYGRLP